MEKKYILNQAAALQKLHRMALELAENLSGSEADLILVGVKESGLVIAKKIANLIQPYIRNKVRLISVSMDKHRPDEIVLSETFDLNNLNVVLIDDVANSGKTLLYGLKPFLNYYPRTIQTMVMVERMHKLYPVKPDYVGLSVATSTEDHIEVEVQDEEITGAYITIRN